MEKIVNHMAKTIGQQLGYKDEQVRVMAYGLSALSQVILLLMLTLLLGLLFRVPVECLIAFFAAGLLRRSIGGAHMDTYFGCIFFSTLMILLFGLLSGYAAPLLPRAALGAVEAIFYLFAFAAIVRYAPLDSPNKPITSPEKIKRLRRAGLFTALIYLLISAAALYLDRAGISAAFSLAAFWQCFAVTPYGHNFIDIFNEVPKKFLGRRFKS